MQNQKNEVPVKYEYDPKSKMVRIYITPFASFALPFNVLKDIYYQTNEMQKQAQILVPDKRIVVPGA